MSSRPIERSTFHMTPSSDPIDDAYAAFETAWRDGARPRIEDYLDVAPPKQRKDFLEALFYLELDHRQRIDDIPTPQEYLDRFPEHADLVRQVFDEALVTLGEYRVLEKVGEGGMGKVFKARHSTMNRVVALKVLPKGHTSDAQAVARFRQEVEIVARLNDPHVVQAFDAGSSRGTHFLVMEFVDGLDLANLVKQRGPLPVPLACEIIRQAAEGLAHAHEHGIVHRDIKPSNLILNRLGVVKLLDLGLARRKFDAVATQGITNPGAIMGTADYMAPEQWDSARTVDIRADIYSLGCTLYYLLAGLPPYGDPSNSSFQQKMRAHTAAPIPDICTLRPDCPAELRQILARLMAKDAGQRYASPVEVTEALASLSSVVGLKELVAGTLECPAAKIGPPSSASKKAVATPVQIDTDASTHETLARQAEAAAGKSAGKKPTLRVATRLALASGLLLLIAAVAYGSWFVVHKPPGDAPQIRQRLATLPGLNGGWWFQETPWFVPSVRAELLAAVSRGELTIGGVDLRKLTSDMHQGSDVPDVYVRLKRASEAIVKERFRGPERALLLGLFDDQEQLTDDSFDKLLTETLDGLAALPTPNPRLLHLRAVLHQHRAKWDEAKAAYTAALAAYESKPGQDTELYALLLADYGRMLTDRGSMHSNSQLELAAHEARNFDTPAFRVVLLCQQAESKERDGALKEAAEFMTNAITLAEHSLAEGHPLRAAAHERMGWVRLDHYKLSQAKSEFAAAAVLRESNLADTHNHRALRFVLHDRQGEYMCQYYLGNHDSAIADLRRLVVARFEQPLAGDSLTSKERRELLERLPNTLERLGDCYLLGTRDFTEAAEVYESAQDQAHLAHWDNGYFLPDLIRLRYKLVIALAMSGGSEAHEKAVKLFDSAEPSEAAALLNDQQKLRYALARELARARLALNDVSAEKRLEGFKVLGEILTEPTPLLRDPNSLNRDDLSLLLLGAFVFFESDTIAAEMPSERQDILGNVARSLVELFHDPIHQSNGELDKFVKPYLASMRTALEASHSETDNPEIKAVLEKLKEQ